MSTSAATAYEYDAMGRLVWVKPALGHDAWTQYVYTPASSPSSPAQVEILRRPNGSETAPALARSKVHFDGFGRVWKEQNPNDDEGHQTAHPVLLDVLGNNTVYPRPTPSSGRGGNCKRRLAATITTSDLVEGSR